MASASISRAPPECTAKCRSMEHAERSMAAITMSGTDEQVADYLQGLCANFCNLVDSSGRTVFHMAASCNRWKLIRWILATKKKQLNTNALALRDIDSQWTPLHRAIFYGQLGVVKVLVEHGASLIALDSEGLSPLHLAIKDRPAYVDYATAGLYEAYVWGINDNYNLGLGTHQGRESPELVDFFRKEGINIKQVVMCKFHTVFLSMSGKVYTCGHGQGGRLGHPTDQGVIVPQSVQFGEGSNMPPIMSIAASNDHSVFLAENGTVWTCGLNVHHQLGHCPPPMELLTPTMLNRQFFKAHSIVGVCTGLYHTVAYADTAVFTFGLNAGQIGHLEQGDALQTAPKIVSALKLENAKLTHVVTSDGATVCSTKNGDVYTLHEYKCRKVASKQHNLIQIAVSGGHLDLKRCAAPPKSGSIDSELRIIFLCRTGQIYIWSGSCPTVKRCLISLGHRVCVMNLALFDDNKALFVTNDGEGFIGQIFKLKVENKLTTILPKIRADQTCSQFKYSNGNASQFSVFIDEDQCYNLKAKRLPNVFRGVRVTCDNKGQNFCIVQANPKVGLIKMPSVSSSNILTELGQLRSTADIHDTVHDVIIEIDDHKFPAHRYLLASRSDYFRRKILAHNSSSKDLVINCSKDIQPAIFEQLLKFIYTDHCDLLTDGQPVSCPSSYASLTPPNQPDLVVSTLGDLHKISAFKMTQERKKLESESKSPQTTKSGQKYMDPVSQLRKAAQKFGIPDLIHKLNYVACIDGKVVVLEPFLKKLFKFDRQKFPELYDVCIVSRNGREMHAHKCILVARSEYFNSMLACGWLETSSPVHLPISADLLEVVVSYLYGADIDHFKRSDDVDFVCNVLVVADLVLLSRLKEFCEVILCYLLTLKNVVDMMNFSIQYNADQLKLSCMNFIGLNLPTLIESKAICALSDDVMDDLSRSYIEMKKEAFCFHGLRDRAIIPCSKWSGKIKFENCESFPTLEESSSQELSPFLDVKAKSNKRVMQKSPSDRKSTRSVSSITVSPKGSSNRRQRTVSTCSVESGGDIKQGNVSLKAKGESVESLKCHDNNEKSPRPLSVEIVCNTPTATPLKWLDGVEDMDHAFPDILNELQRSERSLPRPRVQHVKSADKESFPHATKFSQKQRKKLARKVGQSSSPIPIPHSLMVEKYGRSANWGHDDHSTVMINLRGIKELNGQIPSSPSFHHDDINSSIESTSSELNQSNVVVNVWQMNRKDAGETNSPCFADILKMEEERKAHLQRMQTKQLHFIQMEDKAINELLSFYQNRCDNSENIKVERILPAFVATPVWKHTRTVSK